MGRIGSCVPRHVMSAALAPHCWNATSFADPEYVMDFTSPNAFCAFAITAFASCAIAFAHRNAKQNPTPESFLNTASPYHPERGPVYIDRLLGLSGKRSSIDL